MISPPPSTNKRLKTPLYGLFSVQILALIPVLGLWGLHPDLSLGTALFVQSFVAAVLSRWGFRQARWWLPIHVFFLPLVFLLLVLDVNPLWYLLLFVLSFLVFGGAWLGRVPLFITSNAALNELDQLLPNDENLHFVDLGCGSGAVLQTVQKLRPSWRITGVEAAWLPYCWARWRAGFLGEHVKIIRTDFWQMDWQDIDLVYAYLSPTPMQELWQKLKSQSIKYLISYRFVVPNVPPERTTELADGSCLYRWSTVAKDEHGA